MSSLVNTDTTRQKRTVLTNTRVQDALDSLDESQRRYVVQATIGMMSPTGAALDAGFSCPPTARKVLHALNTLRIELARDLDVSLDDVKRGMMSGINLAEMLGDPSQIIKGWSEMAKLLGLYRDDAKPVINIENMTYVDMTEMSDPELDEIIERAAAIEGQAKRIE